MGGSSKEQRSVLSCPKVETVVDAVAEEAEEDVEGSETCSVTIATSSVICHVTAEAGEHLGEGEEAGGPDLALHHDAEDHTRAQEADRLSGVEADLHPEDDLHLQHGEAHPHGSEVFPHGSEAFPHDAAFLPGETFPQDSKSYGYVAEIAYQLVCNTYNTNLSTTHIMKLK